MKKKKMNKIVSIIIIYKYNYYKMGMKRRDTIGEEDMIKIIKITKQTIIKSLRNWVFVQVSKTTHELKRNRKIYINRFLVLLTTVFKLFLFVCLFSKYCFVINAR